MQRRNNFLTYLLALFPGVGYMYLGLVIRGVETLGIFLLIEPLFRLVGLGFIVGLIKIPIWLYIFFDTINIAKRLDNGETIQDADFIFCRINGHSSGSSVFGSSQETRKSLWLIIGWGLVALGILALVNRILDSFGLFNLVKSYISMYFIPIIFIFVGLYLLFRNKK